MTQGKYPADTEGPDGQIAGADFSRLSLDEGGLEAPLLVKGALTGDVPPQVRSDGVAFVKCCRLLEEGPRLSSSRL
jgi:hypothetical protein